MVVAFAQGEPLIYFRGIAAAQYAVVAPVFITSLDETARLVRFEAALPVADTTPAGLVSDADTRAYATREAVFRLHQHRFRAAVAARVPQPVRRVHAARGVAASSRAHHR